MPGHELREPIETKVTAATAASVVTGLVLWFFEEFVLYYSSVPAPVSGVITAAVLALTTGVAGFAAPHTPRPTDPAPLVDLPPADDTWS